jgi:hypothetical protein
MMKSEHTSKVVLLLSGGKDSQNAHHRLTAKGWDVISLCINGKQGDELRNATTFASLNESVDLHVCDMPRWDETTWNPIKLLKRNLSIVSVVKTFLKNHNSRFLATGVKRSDVLNPRLFFWLIPFLAYIQLIAYGNGVKILFPMWKVK